jgi:hypothetical protein
VFKRKWSYRSAIVGTPLLPVPVPLQLPGIVLWYDPVQEVGYTLLDEVNPVRDFSHNGWNGTPDPARVGPLYVPGERNGQAVFEGTAGVAFETVGLNLQDGDYTIYVACSYPVPIAVNQQRFMHSATGSPLIIGADLDNGLGGDVFSSTSTGTTQGAAVDSTWQALSFRFIRAGDPNRVEIRRMLDGDSNNVQLIASGVGYPAGGADIVQPTWFSQLNGGAHYYLGQTGDIILYNQAHNIGDVLRMMDYLRDKWALAV